ncbi:MAG: helix-turn-helix transcriptional regulator [Clostridia bacterium]|nr:helix-turn-helix transcriptional regulator [Clostridia bacterium]
MDYRPDLIALGREARFAAPMYALILLKASAVSCTLSDVRCYLDGHYLLCLNDADQLTIHAGQYDLLNFGFLPFFYNVNLSRDVIVGADYSDLRVRHGYPDFHLFHTRDEAFCGIVRLRLEEYEVLRGHFIRAGEYIEARETDGLWSCHTRSELISILRVAESCYLGESSHGESSEMGQAILRYVRSHIDASLSLPELSQRFRTNRTTLTRCIKALTGLTPAQYILEERLNQSRPDLLFTGLSIEEIALKYGFSGENYYIRAFRKRFGKSPLQYRLEGRAARPTYAKE